MSYIIAKMRETTQQGDERMRGEIITRYVSDIDSRRYKVMWRVGEEEYAHVWVQGMSEDYRSIWSETRRANVIKRAMEMG